MFINKHSRHRICSCVPWLLVLKLLTVSVECDNTDNSDVCLTPVCKDAAQLIKRNINTTQDPCHNFYNFACGNFKKSVKIRKNESEIGQFTLLGETVMSNLSKALTENIDPLEPAIFKSIKNYYNACMDLKKIDDIGLEPLIKIISDLGGWPMVDYNKWDGNNFDWIETLSKLRQLGYYPNFILTLNIAGNNDNYILEIKEGSTFVKPEILQAEWKDKKLQSYVKYMVDVAVLLGAKDIQQVFSDVYNVIDFERRLSELATEVYAGATYKKIKDIEKYDQYTDGSPVYEIPWLEYINKMTFPIVSYKENYTVRVSAPQYLKELPVIFDEVGKKTVANYIIWRAIAELAPFLSTEIRELHNDFNEIHDSRQQECLKLLFDHFKGLPIATDAFYFKKYVNEDTRKDVDKLIKYMGDQLISYINKLKWLDEPTKVRASNKVRLMYNVIGFPNEKYNDIIRDVFHFNLHTNPNKHLQNVLNTQRLNLDRYFDKLTSRSIGYNLLNMFEDNTYTEVNAYYTAGYNEISLYAALLHSPIYRIDWPNYMKFGALGTIIGHEMMHAFDNSSLIFDAMHNNQWYTNETALKYRNKMKCFVQQYGKYHNKQVNLMVNGSQTLNENLADYGGTILGYAGYKQWVKEYGKESRLPDLNYTPEQIFWIMSAQKECSKSSKSYQSFIMENDTHTLNKFRVFGIVKNSIDFAKDFNCPVGSRMNPKNKCSLAK